MALIKTLVTVGSRSIDAESQSEIQRVLEESNRRYAPIAHIIMESPCPEEKCAEFDAEDSNGD